MFEPVSHPILNSVNPKEVAKFLKERQPYEDEIAEKQKEVPTMTVASFNVSVDRTLLDTMFFVGKFDGIAPDATVVDDLSSDNIRQFIKGFVTHDANVEVNPTLIQQALTEVRVDMEIPEPEARMLQFITDVFSCLEGIGYGDFKVNNPEKTTKLIQSLVYP